MKKESGWLIGDLNDPGDAAEFTMQAESRRGSVSIIHVPDFKPTQVAMHTEKDVIAMGSVGYRSYTAWLKSKGIEVKSQEMSFEELTKRKNSWETN